MSFRDDDEGLRARVNALEVRNAELVVERDAALAAEAAAREAARARREPQETPRDASSPDGARELEPRRAKRLSRRERKQQRRDAAARAEEDAQRSPRPAAFIRWMDAYGGATVMACCAAMMLLVVAAGSLWVRRTSVPVPLTPGAFALPSACGCTSPGGVRYTLEAAVVRTRVRDDLPSRKREWQLDWSLSGPRGRIPLAGLGAPHGALLAGGDLLAESGHLYALGLACPADDRVLVAGSDAVTAWSTEDGHALWSTTVIDAFESDGGFFTDLRIRCSPVSVEDGEARFSREDAADARVDIDDGAVRF